MFYCGEWAKKVADTYEGILTKIEEFEKVVKRYQKIDKMINLIDDPLIDVV